MPVLIALFIVLFAITIVIGLLIHRLMSIIIYMESILKELQSLRQKDYLQREGMTILDEELKKVI